MITGMFLRNSSCGTNLGPLRLPSNLSIESTAIMPYQKMPLLHERYTVHVGESESKHQKQAISPQVAAASSPADPLWRLQLECRTRAAP